MEQELQPVLRGLTKGAVDELLTKLPSLLNDCSDKPENYKPDVIRRIVNVVCKELLGGCIASIAYGVPFDLQVSARIRTSSSPPSSRCSS